MSDNRLSFTDQLLFLGQRATGQELAMQAVWIYDRPVDLDGVRRFHENFGYGLFGRRIEPSPLPIGRHRWVTSTGPQTTLDIEDPRPRDELSDWVDERVRLPLDPEWGPTWHLGVLPMTDGSSAVSLVLSHCLADGFGALLTIVDGIKGNRRDYGYPAAGSRTRLRAATEDLRLTVRGLPEVGRTLVAGARLGFRRRGELLKPKAARPAPVPDGDTEVVAPAVTVYVDLDQWDARAAALNGNTHSLAAGLAAKIAERAGRARGSDGAVTLQVPIADRGADDTRANAANIATVCIDPAGVTRDLSDARQVLKQSIAAIRESPDETLQLLPLTPFIPKRAVRRGSEAVFNFADLPVSFSNLGEVDPVVARLDGTDADRMILRGVDRRVTKEFLEHRGGLLTVLTARVCGKMSVTIVAYRPGARNTKAELRELAAKVLAEFDLTGVIE
ncbi:Fatty acyl-AMP ligase FadD28 and polyketide synthase [Mycolicibacterium phlei]|uniref:Diacylglycerol O-acyltransferase n=1 Tax=Mycolicibacterium phlei DSM 43239 = CCUG 21000 TaxID=1226750 RepID=A0A5N5VBE2_MYCPH|nr:hypothetical protein [Mycolicibacterium phlei]VEG07931.1 Fatty acyl-AMP ligase FadD28 and polyketide synthase [Mycobacteroides chelonae]AMO59804.1 hypothetical protein MPHLCCUG_00974 [Mycolicibacterium phlei]EID18261.1 hypothetical protein MPHLEI_01287 [Mycolicibacterium phlei RIVM601174]KAB7759262.1 hypothetical protein MPHL21000_03310 [Mycolicibacterium phlei DSM 43239 = CCUG 21000]KXW61107.1 hypothetical protein MPHL43070_07075 [Mycolicibacterium phlei DSM 43070]